MLLLQLFGVNDVLGSFALREYEHENSIAYKWTVKISLSDDKKQN